MMSEHATHAKLKGIEATSLEGGVQEIDERERNEKWRVSRSRVLYIEERRLYHRKDGEIVRLRDDVLADSMQSARRRSIERYCGTVPQRGDGPFGGY
jgi:hypothetical protein